MNFVDYLLRNLLEQGQEPSFGTHSKHPNDFPYSHHKKTTTNPSLFHNKNNMHLQKELK
jgi:hypothetical protein